MTNRRLKDLGFTPILTYPVILIRFFAASIYLFAKTDLQNSFICCFRCPSWFKYAKLAGLNF